MIIQGHKLLTARLRFTTGKILFLLTPIRRDNGRLMIFTLINSWKKVRRTACSPFPSNTNHVYHNCSIIKLNILLVFCATICFNINTFAQDKQIKADKYITGPYFDGSGKEISRITVPGSPPEGYRAPVATPTRNSVLLSNVPAYDWSFGCAPTAAAMAAGFYDNTLYPDIYTGPTNGGIMPMDNTGWGSVLINGNTLSQCPLSATMLGLDSRLTRGHVDDYWNYYENGDPDPYIVNGWTQHPYESCTGDFMGSNQSALNCPDGSTIFYVYSDGSALYDFTALEPNGRDGCHGLRLFYESLGYQVVENYSQMIYGYNGNTIGFTFEQFIEEIDNGRPVLIHISGHTMLAYGYQETGQLVYVHDTWDHSMHSMTWAGSYAGRQHFGVTVIRLQSDTPPPLASFTASPRVVDPGQSVDFIDTSSGSPTSWQWTFEGGNPASSAQQNPVVTYNVPGIYTVTLVATNSNGYDTETKNGYISVRHCYATGECSDFIKGLQLREINNIDTDCGVDGYSDYTQLTASLVPGKEYNISVLKDSIILPGEKCGIWFDWNRNNDFTDAGEFIEIQSVADTNLFYGAFTPPLSSPADSLYRMRVRVIKSGELLPCGFTGPGETEDYTIHLLKPVITIAPDTLDFGGIVRFHCSDPLPYTVSAFNLSSPLFITASPDMSVSLDPDGEFTTALSISPVNDTVTETTIYVKFCIYWTTGEYEYIYNNSPGAETQSVTLHGFEVTPPTGNAPDIHVAHVTSMPDTLVVVPVTVSNFNDVQFGYLKLQYKSEALTFQEIINVNPEIDWWLLDAYEYPIDDTTTLNLSLEGSDNPRSIPDNEKLFDLVFTYTHGATPIDFDSTGCSWEDTWYHQMNDVPFEDYYFSGSVSPEVKTLNLNIFLESLTDAGASLMRKAQGDTGDQFPETVADKITIKLASAEAPHIVVQNSGSLSLMQDGSCRLYFPLSFEGTYFLVINHRNSIETWSSAPVEFNSDYLTYSFSDAASSAYGNNLKLIGNRYCIYAGDVNLDGTVDSADMTMVDNDANEFAIGYISTDLTGDGYVDTGDMTILDNNANLFIGRVRP